MARRFDLTGLIAHLMIGLGAFAAVAGAARLPRVSDGEYSTSTVGSPAYAAVFTVTVDGRWWLIIGAAGSAAGALLVIADLRSRRLAGGVGLVVLLAGIVVLAIGVAKLDQQFVLRAPGGGHLNLADHLHISGQRSLEYATGLLSLGWIAAVSRRTGG